MLTLQAYLSEETSTEQIHLLFSIYKNQVVITELQGAAKSSVTDAQAGTARPIFTQFFFKISRKGT